MVQQSLLASIRHIQVIFDSYSNKPTRLYVLSTAINLKGVIIIAVMKFLKLMATKSDVLQLLGPHLLQHSSSEVNTH